MPTGPFGPTLAEDILDTDLLLTRTTDPLRVPAAVGLRLFEARTPGADPRTGIR